jgi:hypothetical protein
MQAFFRFKKTMDLVRSGCATCRYKYRWHSNKHRSRWKVPCPAGRQFQSGGIDALFCVCCCGRKSLLWNLWMPPHAECRVRPPLSGLEKYWSCRFAWLLQPWLRCIPPMFRWRIERQTRTAIRVKKAIVRKCCVSSRPPSCC